MIKKAKAKRKNLRSLLAVDPARELAAALDRCASDWQRAVIAEWGRLHPKGALAPPGFAPTPCWCTRCQAAAVIFPGETAELPESQGYCLCPRCSAPPSVRDALEVGSAAPAGGAAAQGAAP